MRRSRSRSAVGVVARSSPSALNGRTLAGHVQAWVAQYRQMKRWQVAHATVAIVSVRAILKEQDDD